MNTLARLDLLTTASLTSAAHTVKESLRGALYGPKLTPKTPEGETVLFQPACEEAKVRFDIHVALVSNTRSLPVVLS